VPEVVIRVETPETTMTFPFAYCWHCNLNDVFDLCSLRSPLGPTRASDVNILNTLCGEVIEVPSSSSYELSLFSSKVSSAHDMGGGVAPRESSSVSIGDL
jgi:hypothetical protein